MLTSQVRLEVPLSCRRSSGASVCGWPGAGLTLPGRASLSHSCSGSNSLVTDPAQVLPGPLLFMPSPADQIKLAGSHKPRMGEFLGGSHTGMKLLLIIKIFCVLQVMWP